MKDTAILLPVFVLAAWTFMVLLLVAVSRVRAVQLKLVKVSSFRYGESITLEDWTRLPNRNYMNLLELPVLFYVVSLMIYIAGIGTAAMLSLAWAYVGLRLLHSLVHLTYNNVLHRLAVFAMSNLCLLALWALVASALF